MPPILWATNTKGLRCSYLDSVQYWSVYEGPVTSNSSDCFIMHSRNVFPLRLRKFQIESKSLLKPYSKPITRGLSTLVVIANNNGFQDDSKLALADFPCMSGTIKTLSANVSLRSGHEIQLSYFTVKSLGPKLTTGNRRRSLGPVSFALKLSAMLLQVRVRGVRDGISSRQNSGGVVQEKTVAESLVNI